MRTVPLLICACLSFAACGPTSRGGGQGQDTDAATDSAADAPGDTDGDGPSSGLAVESSWSVPAKSFALLDDALIAVTDAEGSDDSVVSAYALDGTLLATQTLPGSAFVSGRDDVAVLRHATEEQVTFRRIDAELTAQWERTSEIGDANEFLRGVSSSHVLVTESIQATTSSEVDVYNHHLLDADTGEVANTLIGIAPQAGLTDSYILQIEPESQALHVSSLDGAELAVISTAPELGDLRRVVERGTGLLAAFDAPAPEGVGRTTMVGQLELDGAWTPQATRMGSAAWVDDEDGALLFAVSEGAPIVRTVVEWLGPDGSQWTEELLGITGAVAANDDLVLVLTGGSTLLAYERQ